MDDQRHGGRLDLGFDLHRSASLPDLDHVDTGSRSDGRLCAHAGLLSALVNDVRHGRRFELRLDFHLSSFSEESADKDDGAAHGGSDLRLDLHRSSLSRSRSWTAWRPL